MQKNENDKRNQVVITGIKSGGFIKLYAIFNELCVTRNAIVFYILILKKEKLYIASKFVMKSSFF